MKIVFTDQYANILFLFNGLAILFYFAAKKKKKQRAMKFGNYETLQKVAGKEFLKSSNIILITKLLALTTLIIGISNPVLVQERTTTNSDFVITIDSSSSMLASDLNPTRLEAAKRISKRFVSRLSEKAQVGVVSFSGGVKKEKVITSDKEEIRATIENIQVGEKAGTAIGDALYASTSMLIDSNRSKKIILITDGRNNVGSSLNESIEYARSHNVTINAIGIGGERKNANNYETINGVNASKARFPNINTDKLNRTVKRTGGTLKVVSNKTELKDAFLDFEKNQIRTELSIYFIFLALGLILTEWLLGTTRYSILP